MHAWQAVEPAVAWNVPATQLLQVDALADALKVPGAQLVGVSEPTEQKVPAGHVTQSLALVITVSVWSRCVPPGHGSGAAERAAQ